MAQYTHSHRVRYRECDPMGIVYHTHYLDFFEAARTEMLRTTGTSYRDIEKNGISMPVVDASVKYKQSAMYDDVLLIIVTIPDEPPTVRVRFEYDVVRESDNTLIATGVTTLCFIDQATGRPCRAPGFAANWFKDV
jgi:acyl-CoA thioester hydrolase